MVWYSLDKGIVLTLAMGNRLFVVDFSSGKVAATRLIAEGGFAFVYEAANIRGEKYALKKVITPYSDKPRSSALKKEIAILKNLPKHPNIVTFYDSVCLVNDVLRQKHFYLLEELCKCNVYDLMKQSGESGLYENDILSIFQDVCMAIHHLHSQQPPIAHRDIKIENILIGFDGRAKLCDFGSCSWKHCVPPDNIMEIGMILDEIEEHTTLDIRAPEQIDVYTKHRICEKVDIWALGVVLFVMCTGRNPFAVPSSGIVEKLGIVNCQVSGPDVWMHSDCLRNIITMLLTISSEDRPSIFDVISHCMEEHLLGNLSMWKPLIPNAAVWPTGNVCYMDEGSGGESPVVCEGSGGRGSTCREIVGEGVCVPLSTEPSCGQSDQRRVGERVGEVEGEEWQVYSCHSK